MLEPAVMTPSKPQPGDISRAKLKSLLVTPLGTIASVFDVEGAFGLTFDDGPDPDVTPRMLEVLNRHGAKATFFVLTEAAEAHPALLARLLAEGHEIGLHFDRHDRIPSLPPMVAFRRLREARRRLADAAGGITLFRPPYGGQNYLTFAMARALGLEVVGWNRQAHDWVDQPAAQSAARATDDLSGGDIVLLHDGLIVGPDEPVPTLDRVEVLDLLLTEAGRRGLTALTVGQLMARGAPRRVRWFV